MGSWDCQRAISASARWVGPGAERSGDAADCWLVASTRSTSSNQASIHHNAGRGSPSILSLLRQPSQHRQQHADGFPGRIDLLLGLVQCDQPIVLGQLGEAAPMPADLIPDDAVGPEACSLRQARE